MQAPGARKSAPLICWKAISENALLCFRALRSAGVGTTFTAVVPFAVGDRHVGQGDAVPPDGPILFVALQRKSLKARGERICTLHVQMAQRVSPSLFDSRCCAPQGSTCRLWRLNRCASKTVPAVPLSCVQTAMLRSALWWGIACGSVTIPSVQITLDAPQPSGNCEARPGPLWLLRFRASLLLPLLCPTVHLCPDCRNCHCPCRLYTAARSCSAMSGRK